MQHPQSKKYELLLLSLYIHLACLGEEYACRSVTDIPDAIRIT
jgi:hypothetical protein